jgi:hypothetical protein
VPPDERPAGEHRCEPDVARAGPEAGFREGEERAEGKQADAGEQPGVLAMAAQGLDGDRLVVVLARDHEVRGEVEQQAGASGQRERRERDAVDERVDVEVAAEAGCDPAEPAAVVDADEPPRGRLVDWGRVVGEFGHVSLL